MQVVKIRCKAESFDGSLDIRVDMSGRVTDASSWRKDFKTALRGNCG
jgi:hypothetical protein